jgi:hypothetical protein
MINTLLPILLSILNYMGEPRHLDFEVMIVDKQGIAKYNAFTEAYEKADTIYVMREIEILIEDLGEEQAYSEQELQILGFTIPGTKRLSQTRDMTMQNLQNVLHSLQTDMLSESNFVWVSELVFHYNCNYLYRKFWFLIPRYNFRVDFLEYCKKQNEVGIDLIANADLFRSYPILEPLDSEVYTHHLLEGTRLSAFAAIDLREFLADYPDFDLELALINSFIQQAEEGNVDIVIIYAWD